MRSIPGACRRVWWIYAKCRVTNSSKCANKCRMHAMLVADVDTCCMQMFSSYISSIHNAFDACDHACSACFSNLKGHSNMMAVLAGHRAAHLMQVMCQHTYISSMFRCARTRRNHYVVYFSSLVQSLDGFDVYMVVGYHQWQFCTNTDMWLISWLCT